MILNSKCITEKKLDLLTPIKTTIDTFSIFNVSTEYIGYYLLTLNKISGFLAIFRSWGIVKSTHAQIDSLIFSIH